MPARSPDSPLASTADVAACRAMLRGGSRSFFAASLVLPRGVRDPATALYAFCRIADDAVDLGADPGAAILDLHERLDRIYAGAPRDVPADRAFADVVARFAIPERYPRALLEGFEWDVGNRRYRTLAELHAYGVRVAGTVGAMMAMVMDIREPLLIARACDLGVAMQLTNIARDVGEDARNGRLYLPLEWLREAGIEAEEWLRRPRFDERLAGVVRRLLASAEELYLRADGGISNLPPACRPGMYAARLLYAEIGREVERLGLDSVTRRAVVPWRRKARILADAVRASTRTPPRLDE
ncbi:MAG: phytoene/squalene synthase family protein, partial [Gammaproteobacteria bacterium]|nr:phytoene/squalene synthase family protein [Gammaproteobacteria bacterium]